MSDNPSDGQNLIRAYSDAICHLLPTAASGSRSAQAELAKKAMDVAVFHDGSEALVSARWWARLAASHELAEDVMFYVGVLMVSARDAAKRDMEQVASTYRAEAMMLLNGLADTGNEEAASYLQSVSDQMTPEESLWVMAASKAQKSDDDGRRSPEQLVANHLDLLADLPFAEAAAGSEEKQAGIAASFLTAAKTGIAPYEPAVRTASVIARLAATQGSAYSAHVLANCLITEAGLPANPDTVKCLLAEAIAWLNRSAEGGIANAEKLLQGLTSNPHYPEVIAMAAQMEKRL